MENAVSLAGGVLESQWKALPDTGPDSWRALLGQVFTADPERYRQLDRTLTELYEKEPVNPARENLLRAFRDCPADRTVLVLCGQDPYPNREHAMGLSFSVPAGTKLPPSMKNILKELESDIGGDLQSAAGDLRSWAEQGVLLLNTALSVREGEPNSHKALWDGFAVEVLTQLNRQRKQPLAFLLWGKQAHEIGKRMEKTAPADSCRLFLYSVHPSPLSAYRGFFGSKPFSRINEFLQEHGEQPIRW